MRTLQVYQPNKTTGVLEMRFPTNTASEVHGVQALLQSIVLYLKTKPNSDAFSPNKGSILGDPERLSKAITNPTQLRVLVNDAIMRCQEFIMTEQQKQKEGGAVLEDEYTLNQLEINNIYQGADPTTIFIELLVYTEGNKTYFLTV